MPMEIRAFQTSDRDEWMRMRRALWPEMVSEGEHEEAQRWLDRANAAVLVLQRESSMTLGGFVEVGERAYADGCDASPIAFLEGWYVDPDLRRQGWGKALVEASADWARAHGYREFASDSVLEDERAYHAHLGAGFAEVERAIRYKRVL